MSSINFFIIYYNKTKAKILSNNYHAGGSPFLCLIPIQFTVCAGGYAEVCQIVCTRMRKARSNVNRHRCVLLHSQSSPAHTGPTELLGQTL